MKKAAAAVWSVCAGLLRAVLSGLFRIAGKELTEPVFQKILQFVKFGIVGVGNTAISLLVYYVIILIRREWYIAGSIAGFVISVLNAYYWNSKYVFRKQDDRLRTLIRTYIAYGSNLLIGTFMLWLLVEKCGISHFLAPLLNLLITVPLNFVLNKYWVMKPSPQKDKPA